jgi:hypothetical protein
MMDRIFIVHLAVELASVLMDQMKQVVEALVSIP